MKTPSRIFTHLILLCLLLSTGFSQGASGNAAPASPPKPEKVTPPDPVAEVSSEDDQASAGTSISAAFSAVSNKISELVHGSNKGFAGYVEAYNRPDINSTPFLYFLGIPLGSVLEGVHFKMLITALMTAFIAIGISNQFRNGNGGTDYYAGLFMKVFASGLILANPEYIYASAKSLQDVGLKVVQGIGKEVDANPNGPLQRVWNLGKGNPGMDPAVHGARAEGVKAGLERREGIFTSQVSNPEMDAGLLDYMATFYNAYGPALFQQQPPASGATINFQLIPRIVDSDSSAVRAEVIKAYTRLGLYSASIPADRAKTVYFPIRWEYKDKASYNRSSAAVESLSKDIEDATEKVIKNLSKTPMTGDGVEVRRQLLDQYKETVASVTARWVDSEIIHHMTLAMEGQNFFVGLYRDTINRDRATLSSIVGGMNPLTWVDSLTKFATKTIEAFRNVLLVPFVMVAYMGLSLILELSLLGLIFAVPLWFFSGTSRAFTGALETMMTTAFIMPVFFGFLILVDCLFGTVIALVIGGSTASFAAGLITGPSAAAIVAGLVVAQIITSFVLLFKTPALFKKFLSGAGWVTAFLGSVATGIATAALVGGGALVAAGGGAAAVGAKAGASAAGAQAGAGAGSVGAGASSTAGASAATTSGSGGGGVLTRVTKDVGDTLFHLARNNFDPAKAAESKISANRARRINAERGASAGDVVPSFRQPTPSKKKEEEEAKV